MSIEIISKYLDQYQNRFYKYSHQEHIERWLSQFQEQEIIAFELAHILEKTFIEEKNEKDFFEMLVKNPRLISDIGVPGNYSILDIQVNGTSQAIYSRKLKEVFNYSLNEDVPINDFSKDVLIYVDDFMFSGMKARHDILNLFKEKDKRKVVYIFLGVHSNADYYLSNSFKSEGIVQSVWRCINFNNTMNKRDTSDVFWPKESIKSVPLVEEFLENIKTKCGKEVVFRSDTSSSVGELEVFSNSQNREIIENEFLLAGIKIVKECNTEMLPMGKSAFKASVGFGGTAMSYRNIPNNTPLCLWWGSPQKSSGLGTWYPLMMRRVYD